MNIELRHVRAGFAHGMYLGTSVDLFVIRNSIVRSNHDDGHLVKSRAKQNIIECNTIAGLNGLNSFAIDLPQGGDATVRNNVIEQGPMINNSSNFMINFAEENTSNVLANQKSGTKLQLTVKGSMKVELNGFNAIKKVFGDSDESVELSLFNKEIPLITAYEMKWCRQSCW